MATEISQINKKLVELNKLTEPYKLAYVHPKELLLLEKNARYMSKEQMGRLVNNISRDGYLSQLPFCMRREDGQLLVLSGNHRVKAAIKSELDFIMVQYMEEVDKDKWLALQLSHNSIVGTDDESILKELYDMLESMEAKEYSAIDEAMLNDFEGLDVCSISEAGITMREVTFIFSDIGIKDLDTLLLELNSGSELKKVDKRFVGVDFYAFIEIMSTLKNRLNIKNHTVAFMKMLTIVDNWCKEHGDKENN